MSSGQRGSNNPGNPWNQGRTFAQVASSARSPPLAQSAGESRAPPQSNVDNDGFTIVQNNRRNRNGHGHGQLPAGHGSGRGRGGAQFGGDGRRNEPSRGRGAHRGHSQGGRGRGSYPQRSFNDSPHNSQGSWGNQGGSQGYRCKSNEPPKLYNDYKKSTHQPSQGVKSLEDDIVKENQKDLTLKLGNLKLADHKFSLPMRPGYGNHPTVNLLANYFEISGISSLVFYEFNVHFQATMSLRVKQRLFTLLLQQPPLNNESVATNYVDKLICVKKLSPQNIRVGYYEDGETGTQSHTVTLQYSRSYRMAQLLADLRSPFESYDRDERNMAIQALNMAVARFPNHTPRIQCVGQSRHFFLNPTEDLSLGGGLEARRGFFHSVKPSTGRLLLNLNVSTAAFYRAGNLKDVSEEVVPFTAAEGDSRRTGILDRFLRKPARYISVKEYFRRQYNVILEDNQIVINVARQKLSPDQTTNMIRIACRNPTANALDISGQGLNLMGVGRREGPKEKFGIDIAHELLSVKGMVLSPPRLKYKMDSMPSLECGSWNFTGHLFRKAGHLPGTNPIGVITVGTFKSEPEDFLKSLKQTLQGYDINWRDSGSTRIRIPATHRADENRYRQAFQQFKNMRTPYVIVLLPRFDQQVYSYVKYYGDIVTGIPNTCVTEKYVKKEKRITFKTDGGAVENIALKINLKLGGINHEIQSDGRIHDIIRTTMFIGIDVTHPTGTDSQSGAPSISAVVANNDPTLAQWPASITTQEHRKEMVESVLERMVTDRLRAWKDQDKLPARIIVYRDGVSESQYQEVLDTELVQIQSAVEQHYAGRSLPKITLLIVGKRHHTRKRDSRNCCRPLLHHGTQTLTSSWSLMQESQARVVRLTMSYSMTRTTSRLISYKVFLITNSTKTHDLTWVYGRAARSVSIATPAYYADIVCERGRCYLYSVFNNALPGQYQGNNNRWMQGVHPNLQDTMFYI
ncbi:eukaryotic translation initiation factor 2C 2 [Coccidioides immitis RMSCC 3703]|uniref:Eukaryotic translation initiation factor 2C 2 n=1 Tax=Coccidioides immitis RMSCC 3703 TaxID=454286 RepID=A0A0J8R2X0_COCIT|nr:eukaryotic translation initiation factor 2C 2 [Coccidioides immitis RMSCC 3703]